MCLHIRISNKIKTSSKLAFNLYFGYSSRYLIIYYLKLIQLFHFSNLFPIISFFESVSVAVVNVAGLSKGIIIALIVLGVVILIVLILMILLFVHGRRRRSRQYDEPDGYK